MTRALAGRTVVVTRAADQASILRTKLEAEGATVIELPLIAIGDPDDRGAALVAALADPDAYDWIVVTSPNGAGRVAAVLGRRVVGARFAAVGRGTAEALGRPVGLQPRRQVAEGLLAEFPAGTGRVLVVQGDLARPTLVDGLVALGWRVDRVVAYRNVPVAVAPGTLATAAEADAVTFASGSAVRAFAAVSDLLGPSPTERGRPVVVSIGPATSAVARELGIVVDHTAAEHDLDGLVRAVVVALAAPG